jgi:hypothetical protein
LQDLKDNFIDERSRRRTEIKHSTKIRSIYASQLTVFDRSQLDDAPTQAGVPYRGLEVAFEYKNNAEKYPEDVTVDVLPESVTKVRSSDFCESLTESFLERHDDEPDDESQNPRRSFCPTKCVIL